MTTIGTRTWRPGTGRRPGAGHSRAQDADKNIAGTTDPKADPGKPDVKLLAKSEASLAESERMLSRQMILLAELRADGFVTTEAEKSVARLEAALLTQRSAHESLLTKARPASDVAPQIDLMAD